MKKLRLVKRPPEQIKQLKGSEIRDFRTELLNKQGGLCPICRRKVYDPVLDHSHKKRNRGTGQIRAVVCRNCNTFLGKIENNCVRYSTSHANLPFILKSMSEYLLKQHLNFIHPSEKPKAKKLKLLSYNRLKKFYEGNAKFPEYPKSGKLTVKLKQLFEQYHITPEYYK